MNKTTTLLALCAASTALAGTPSLDKAPRAVPQAPEPSCTISYNYFQAFYEHAEFDVPGMDNSDGANFQLSFSPAEFFYFSAGGGSPPSMPMPASTIPTGDCTPAWVATCR